MKTYPASLAIREVRMKRALRFHLIVAIMATIKTTDNTCWWKGAMEASVEFPQWKQHHQMLLLFKTAKKRILPNVYQHLN